MKKIISILLAVMLVVSVTVVSVNAYNNGDGDYTQKNDGSSYNPSDSYTVDDNTPTCEEAILACGGNLADTQKIYFQLPLEDPNQKGSDWANKFNTDANGVCQVCVYWWGGIAGAAKNGWPSGKGCTWVGYRTKLVDAENRIYMATIPADGNSPVMIWDNGVNGGMDDTKEIFNYARQLADANIEGAYEGDYDTLPEGTPNEDNMDGCIQIIDYDPEKMVDNPLTGFPSYGSNWYVYYGDGCYGYYPTSSPNYHGKTASCVNPEHHHPKPGDVNDDKVVDVLDVLCIQYYLAGYTYPDEFPEGMKFDLATADVDGDEYVSIIDATRIQRYLAKFCNIDGSTPYKESEE